MSLPQEMPGRLIKAIICPDAPALNLLSASALKALAQMGKKAIIYPTGTDQHHIPTAAEKMAPETCLQPGAIRRPITSATYSICPLKPQHAQTNRTFQSKLSLRKAVSTKTFSPMRRRSGRFGGMTARSCRRRQTAAAVVRLRSPDFSLTSPSISSATTFSTHSRKVLSSFLQALS